MIGSLVRDRATTGVVPGPDVAVPAADSYRAFIESRLEESYRLATFILGQPADAEDAVHDAAIAAWRHWTERRDLDRTAAWFRRIVVNACRDRIRGRRRVRAVDVGLDIELAHHPLSADPAEAVANRDDIGALLERLTVDERVLLTLRFGLDLTVPAIAAVLGVPEGTVKSRLHRALDALRSMSTELTP
jgi:RNA polymerase sigma-70 factor (ECF subfamily)